MDSTKALLIMLMVLVGASSFADGVAFRRLQQKVDGMPKHLEETFNNDMWRLARLEAIVEQLTKKQ